MQDHLTQTFSALADPTRRAMLAQLSKGEANVSELAKPFLKSMSLPAVTKHVKVLERAGLITKTREAQWRPCKLNPPALKDVADRMEEYLKTVTAKTAAAEKQAKKKSNQAKTIAKGKHDGRKK